MSLACHRKDVNSLIDCIWVKASEIVVSTLLATICQMYINHITLKRLTTVISLVARRMQFVVLSVFFILFTS